MLKDVFVLSKLIMIYKDRRTNDRHYTEDIFMYIFWNEDGWISITISLKFVLKGLVDKIPALVQIMAWRRQATSHYLNQ